VPVEDVVEEEAAEQQQQVVVQVEKPQSEVVRGVKIGAGMFILLPILLGVGGLALIIFLALLGSTM